MISGQGYSTEKIIEVLRDFKSGMKDSELTAKHGMCHGTIHTWAKKAGVIRVGGRVRRDWDAIKKAL